MNKTMNWQFYRPCTQTSCSGSLWSRKSSISSLRSRTCRSRWTDQVDLRSLTLTQANVPKKVENQLRQDALAVVEETLADDIGDTPITAVVMALMTWLSERVVETSTASEAGSQDEASNALSLPSNHGMLIHLDHMRDAKRYTQRIRDAVLTHDLAGRLLIQGRWIFIFLSGSRDGCHGFLQWLRTAKVDVNSKGQPCKERMATVLYDDVVEESSQYEINSCSAGFDKCNVVDVITELPKCMQSAAQAVIGRRK
eukprot:TRINITY_DN5922_c0_g1_i1.p1 TRINITY_DN5922_c0_g1~~TRINITY_DN5922_c0_g1_i1.p1  ORF type:complete len:254 (+),score=16.94 TRINITY_DN5922_c0_g1_i1:88-849(+)